MGVTDRYGIYAVHLNNTLLGAITEVDDAYESTVRGEPRSGEVLARFMSLISQKARVGFSTEALKVLLDTVTTTDNGIPLKYSNIAAAVWASGLRLYWQDYASGGSRKGASSHIQDKVNAGIICLRRLTCQHQGDAVAQVEAICGWDGTNDMIARTFGVTLPAAPADDARYTLIDDVAGAGVNKVGNIVIPQLKSMEIDFGFGIDREGSGSDIQDKFVFLKTVQPTITLRSIDPTLFASAKIPVGGINCTHANTKLYLRKRAAGGSFVANGTTDHISVTADGMATLGQIGRGSGQDASEIVLMIQCRMAGNPTGAPDSTNAPLIFNTATAIT